MESGFYWVRDSKGWAVAHLVDNYWWFIGDEFPEKEDPAPRWLKEIGPRIDPPKDCMSLTGNW